MYYSSTRGLEKNNSFEDVLLNGLAKDGGLYVPNRLKKFKKNEIEDFKSLDYYELAYKVTFDFVKEEISDIDYLRICKKTYDNFSHDSIISHTQLDKNEAILNLFNGPTLAFKDFALQLLGNIYEFFLEKRNSKLTIIGATSGDTGSAAINGCSQSDRVKMFILFPHNKVSEIQRKQMTTIKKENVFNIAIKGNFDDCQNIVKSLFERNNIERKYNLAAVNSINWVRIMGQIVYYFWSYINFAVNGEKINFAVPTGNFGNVYAGYLAKQMGLPINKLVIASNSNDVLTRFFETGIMKKRTTVKTLSPSMDIQVSSNFERLLFDFMGKKGPKIKEFYEKLRHDGNFSINKKKLAKISNFFVAGRLSDRKTQETIQKIYNEFGVIVDPHTAVGICLGRELLKKNEKNVYLATAHYGKFLDTIKSSLKKDIRAPKNLDKIKKEKEEFKIMENNLDIIDQFIQQNN